MQGSHKKTLAPAATGNEGKGSLSSQFDPTDLRQTAQGAQTTRQKKSVRHSKGPQVALSRVTV